MNLQISKDVAPATRINFCAEIKSAYRNNGDVMEKTSVAMEVMSYPAFAKVSLMAHFTFEFLTLFLMDVIRIYRYNMLQVINFRFALQRPRISVF